jgi:flagellar protein FliS
MSPQAKWAQSYRAVATQTASPGQRVLMLFDGIIKFLERAKLGFDLDDPLDRNQTIFNNISRARAIIHELNAALNLNEGGELASTLRRLYEYFDWRLDEGLRVNRTDPVDDVIRRVTVLRDAWHGMLNRQEPELQPAEALVA